MTFGQFFFWVLVILIVAGVTALAIFYEKRLLDALATQGFRPSFIHVNGMVKTGIAIDETNESIAILWPGVREPTLFDFNEIVAVEIRRNDQVVERTNRKRQLVGAVVGKAIAGNVGAVIMGVTASRRHEQKVTKLALMVFTSDLAAPSAEIVFFQNSQGISPRLATAHERKLDDWYGRMLGIIKIADRANS